jgi:hypothetical protein
MVPRSQSVIAAEYVDVGFYEITPYAVASLIILAIPENAWAVYSFIGIFFGVIVILLAKLIFYLFVSGSLRVAWFFVKQHSITVATWTSYWIRLIGAYFIGKFIFVLLVAHTVAVVAYLLYYHFDLYAIVRSTVDFIHFVIHNFGAWRKLLVAIHDWLHSIVIGKLVDLIRTTWIFERDLLEKNPVAGIVVALMITALQAFVLFLGYAIRFIIQELIKDFNRRSPAPAPPVSPRKVK